jgi:hypothetical protein
LDQAGFNLESLPPVSREARLVSPRLAIRKNRASASGAIFAAIFSSVALGALTSDTEASFRLFSGEAPSQ